MYSSIPPLNKYSFDEKIITKFVKPFNIIGERIISIRPKILSETALSVNAYAVHIFITDGFSLVTSKAGVIEYGSRTINVIFLRESACENEMLHELGHALFELGDAYGDMDFPGTSRKETGFKNLSFKPYNEEWEYIKELTGDEKIGYYEGGMGFKNGVFRPYENCLMRDLKSEFCPVCLYYIDKKMRSLASLK
jgi:hypothetical protein